MSADPFLARPGLSGRRLAGIGVAVGVHVVAGWALLAGLVRREPAPEIRTVEARLIADAVMQPTRPPPPPPPPPPPRPPPPAPPPPLPAPIVAAPALPPVQTQAPRVLAAAPTAPAVIAAPEPATPVPSAPPVAAAPAPVPPAAVTAPSSAAVTAGSSAPGAGAVVPNPAPPAVRAPLRRGVAPLRVVRPVYPQQALRDDVEGDVLARATVGRNGRVTAVVIVSARPRGVFDRAVEAALRQYEFPPEDQEYLVEVPFSFRLE